MPKMYVHADRIANTASLSNVISPELLRSSQKTLIINTRCRLSDLLDRKERAKVNEEDFFIEMLKKNEDLYKSGVPEFDVMQLTHLKLSADQSAEDWVELAEMIQKHYHNYRGFVVQNGTDNVCVTASALSFMLQNLAKPVIFTGSLIPGERIYTDLKRNIILALTIAASGQLCEVGILFNDRLFRANRTTRVNRCNLEPFASPHYPPLGTMQESCLQVHSSFLQTQPHGALSVMPYMSASVLTLYLGPGLQQETLKRVIELTTAQAVILCCYGSGNGPSRDKYMTSMLDLAKKRDLVIVICTQNRFGVVQISKYATGQQLLKAGAISANDMTLETVIVKLKYLFGLGLTPHEVRGLLHVDLRGEVTNSHACHAKL